MKCLFKAIKICDNYGRRVAFNMNGKEASKSLIGGICSLINLITFWVILLLNFVNFLFDREVYLTFNTSFRNFSILEEVNISQLRMGTFFVDVNSNTPKPKIIFPTSSQGYQTLIEVEEKSKINSKIINIGQFENCEGFINKLFTENEELSKLIENVMKLSNNTNYVSCFNQKSPFSIGGDLITGNKFGLLSIKSKYDTCNLLDIKPCRDLSKNDFKNIETKYILMIENSSPDKRLREGFENFIQLFQTHLDFSMELNVRITVKKIKMSTDNNYLYNFISDVEKERFVYTASFSYTTRQNTDPYEFVINHYFDLDPYIDEYERSYLKFDGMLANVGSFIFLIEYFTKVMSEFFTEGNMEHLIYKEIFHIKNKHRKLSSDFWNVDERIFKGKINSDQINSSKYENRKNAMNKNNGELIDITNNPKDHIISSSFRDSSNIHILNVKNDESHRAGNNPLIIENIEMKLSNNEDFADFSSPIKNKDLKFILHKQQFKKTSTKAEAKDYKIFRKLLKEKMIKKSHLIRFNQIFLPCFIKNNKNFKMLKNIQEFISEELDVINILKKLIEYEHFKGLILTPKQQKIFNLMQKRVLTEDMIENGAKDYYKGYFFKNKMKDVKNFKYLVDQMFDYEDENKYSKIILKIIKENFSL